MAKKKIETKTEDISIDESVMEPIVKPATELYEEVIGINAAEGLQKSGWQLVDCHHSPQGKVYKFKKGK